MTVRASPCARHGGDTRRPQGARSAGGGRCACALAMQKGEHEAFATVHSPSLTRGPGGGGGSRACASTRVSLPARAHVLRGAPGEHARSPARCLDRSRSSEKRGRGRYSLGRKKKKRCAEFWGVSAREKRLCPVACVGVVSPPFPNPPFTFFSPFCFILRPRLFSLSLSHFLIFFFCFLLCFFCLLLLLLSPLLFKLFLFSLEYFFFSAAVLLAFLRFADLSQISFVLLRHFSLSSLDSFL